MQTKINTQIISSVQLTEIFPLRNTHFSTRTKELVFFQEEFSHLIYASVNKDQESKGQGVNRFSPKRSRESLRNLSPTWLPSLWSACRASFSLCPWDDCLSSQPVETSPWLPMIIPNVFLHPRPKFTQHLLLCFL